MGNKVSNEDKSRTKSVERPKTEANSASSLSTLNTTNTSPMNSSKTPKDLVKKVPAIFFKKHLFSNETAKDKIARLSNKDLFRIDKDSTPKKIYKTKLNEERLVKEVNRVTTELIALKVNSMFSADLFNAVMVPDLELNNPELNKAFYYENCYKSNIEGLRVLNKAEDTMFRSEKLSVLFDRNNLLFTEDELDELNELKARCEQLTKEKDKQLIRSVSTPNIPKHDDDNMSRTSRKRTLKRDSKSKDSKAKLNSKSIDNTNTPKTPGNSRNHKRDISAKDILSKSFDRRKAYDVSVQNKTFHRETAGVNIKIVEAENDNQNHYQTMVNAYATATGISPKKHKQTEVSTDDQNSSLFKKGQNPNSSLNAGSLYKKKPKVKTIVHKVDYSKMIEYYKKNV